jgi:hypothetical protein
VAAPQQVSDPYAHSGPWTEEEFLALPVDTRLELVDGALVMSPSGANAHQRLATRIWGALDTAATAGYLRVEQDGPDGHLHVLDDGAYRETARCSSSTSRSA